MRSSLDSLAICLVSAQARIALASPCKPVSTTAALAGTTTTTAIGQTSTTTAITGDSTSTVPGDTTITALSDLSTTLTLSEGSTTTAATTEPTTTTFEATTTTAAETTTTTEALEGTQMPAVFADNSVKDTYIDRWGGTYSTPQEGGSTSKARFQLEPGTNRLFTYLIDGIKVYLFTVIPGGPNYSDPDYDSQPLVDFKLG